MNSTEHHTPRGSAPEDHTVASYEQSVSNLSQVSLGRDGVFSDGVAGQMPTVAGAAGSGYTIALTIGI